MTDKELRHLSRMELVQLLLDQTRETERLTEEVEHLREQLEDRNIQIRKTGSIAEAALQINGVMEAAQQAADQYIENVKRVYEESAARQYEQQKKRLEQLERDTKAKCVRLLEAAHRQAGGENGSGA